MGLLKSIMETNFINDKDKNVIQPENDEYLSIKKTYLSALDNHYDTYIKENRRLKQFFEQLRTIVENFDIYKDD